MPWEDLKPIFRPETVHMGVMELERDKCTKCGLCIKNCPLQAWEEDADGFPLQTEGADCFSCFNCMVPCPSDAISIVDVYHVDSGFYATDPHPLPAEMPLEPLDADGNLDEWNTIERAVYERRSVRNFRNKDVPETTIRRVLEAGRFAPSAGNCQPWKFIVVTNKALIQEMNNTVYNALNMMHATYNNDDLVKNLAPMYEADPSPGTYDPRMIVGGLGSVVKGALPVFLNAPVAILILGDERAISGPEINVGICGQNMNLVANSLGIKACWNGFLVTGVPAIADKINLKPNWSVITTLVLGWPKFKQVGMVPREYRPVKWFREPSEYEKWIPPPV